MVWNYTLFIYKSWMVNAIKFLDCYSKDQNKRVLAYTIDDQVNEKYSRGWLWREFSH